MTEKERYTERVRDIFENFIVSKFIEYKPYSISDEYIISDAIERSVIKYDGGRLQWMQSFASIFTIEGAKEMEYNGKNFTVLELKAANDKLLQVKFTDFRYYTSFYNGEHDSYRWEYKFDESNARFIDTVNNQPFIPELLASQVGAKILKGYDFPTINKYGKLRECYRFYSLCGDTEQDADTIRRQILRAQAFALLLAAKYPVLCLPSYNFEHIEPYMYEITKEIGSLFSQQLRVKLSEVERALNEHGLTYEHNI